MLFVPLNLASYNLECSISYPNVGFQARMFNLKLRCSFSLTSDLELWTYLQREE